MLCFFFIFFCMHKSRTVHYRILFIYNKICHRLNHVKNVKVLIFVSYLYNSLFSQRRFVFSSKIRWFCSGNKRACKKSYCKASNCNFTLFYFVLHNMQATETFALKRNYEQFYLLFLRLNLLNRVSFLESKTFL